MRIGIYKPTKKIYFYENTEDHAAWSAEIVDIIKIFVNHQNEVYIMSDTDYDNSIENVFKHAHEKLDKIFVFNGMMTTFQEIDMLSKLKQFCDDVSYILSDMRLKPNFPYLYNNIFSQSKRLYSYGAIQEHQLVDYKPEIVQEKTIEYYFGGTERGRSNDFMNYIIRPGCVWTGKSETLGISNYVPHHKHIELLKKAKTTIIIADEEYNLNGFVNDRYYECAKYDVICFADSKWDPDELIMRKDDWRRVSSYNQLLFKQKMLQQDNALYNEILTKQRFELFARSKAIQIYNLLINQTQNMSKE